MNKLIISVYDILLQSFDGNVDPILLLLIIIVVTAAIVLLKFRCYM